MIRAFRGAMAVLVAASVAACSSATQGTAGGDPSNQIMVQVENDFIPPTSLSVYAVPEIGSRRLVGVVRPNETTMLSWPATAPTQYVFVAETTTGQEIVSNSVNLGAGETAVWNVRSNVVTLR